MRDTAFLQQAERFTKADAQLVQNHFLDGLAPLVSQPLEQTAIADTWPTFSDEALHGLAGEVVRLYEPHTEAAPVALLVSFLSEVGVMLGRAPHLILDGGYHPLLFWPVLVGKSSKSRKGTAVSALKVFANRQTRSGLVANVAARCRVVRAWPMRFETPNTKRSRSSRTEN